MTEAATLTRKIHQFPIAVIAADPDCELRAACFRARAEFVFERIADHLTEVKIPLFDPPSPRPPDDPAAPMIDARRDFLTQIAHCHAWQSRSNNLEAD